MAAAVILSHQGAHSALPQIHHLDLRGRFEAGDKENTNSLTYLFKGRKGGERKGMGGDTPISRKYISGARFSKNLRTNLGKT